MLIAFMPRAEKLRLKEGTYTPWRLSMALVKLTEVFHNNTLTTQQDYTLREVFINPEHVVMIREEMRMQQLNEQGHLPDGIAKNHQFTKLTINRGKQHSTIKRNY